MFYSLIFKRMKTKRSSLLPKAALLISTQSFAPIYVLARSRSCVCPDVVIPGGNGGGGGVREKY